MGIPHDHYGTVHHRTGTTLAVHHHARAYLIVVDRGDYLITGLEGNLRVRQGDAIIHPFGDSHGNVFGGVDVMLRRSPIRPSTQVWPQRTMVLRGLDERRLHECLRAGDLVGPAVEGLLQQADPVPCLPPPPLVRDVLAAGTGRSNAELHTLLGASPDRVNRAFVAWYGAPRRAYRSHLRRRAAAALIWCTDKALSAIALEAGYCDQQHFTNDWRAAFGGSPGVTRAARDSCVCGSCEGTVIKRRRHALP